MHVALEVQVAQAHRITRTLHEIRNLGQPNIDQVEFVTHRRTVSRANLEHITAVGLHIECT